MVKLVWTELSTVDLKEIFDYIAIDSVRYASITVNKIYNRAQDIIDNPYVGRIVPEINIKLLLVDSTEGYMRLTQSYKD